MSDRRSSVEWASMKGVAVGLLCLMAPTPSLAAVGGPDAHGYTWIDSDEPGGPTYDAAYQPPAGGLGLCQAEWYTVNLGFDFEFYGASYSRVAISANGALYPTNASLDTMNGGDDLNACPLDAALHPRLAVLWDDYYANNNYFICGGGSFFITSAFGYTTLGAAPDRVFIASWIDNRHMSCGNNGATFTARRRDIHERLGCSTPLLRRPGTLRPARWHSPALSPRRKATTSPIILLENRADSQGLPYGGISSYWNEMG